ncbi:hypothetical protein BJ741DRAFT_551463 [Chytriomyces cf. hyalinus JEL632]|nr:hypothetical protein BJ741DRAFT_551463 [Chytriomyces cf. hyalinus JEL632]
MSAPTDAESCECVAASISNSSSTNSYPPAQHQSPSDSPDLTTPDTASTTRNAKHCQHILESISSSIARIKQNKSAFQRLLSRANLVLGLASSLSNGSDAMAALDSLKAFLDHFQCITSKLEEANFMHNFINKDTITAKVMDLNQSLTNVAQDISLAVQLDTRTWAHEDREDRKQDAEDLDQTLQHLIDNDYKILNALELKQVEYLEAIEALEKTIGDQVDRALEKNLEKQFLKIALTTLRRATPSATPTKSAITKPPEWVLTSWEFELGPVLSRGGFGEVLEALWLGHTRVALKRLHIRLETEKLKESFYREVATWYPLRHPNILPLLGACASAERPFMISPLMQRGHALQYLEYVGNQGVGGNAVETAGVKLLYEVSLGMQYLHARGVCHGDLKAVNVLVDEHGKACVADFGFAALKRYSTTKTSAGAAQFGGTLRWMSPERLQGGKLSSPVDVYAFGMTCYEILTLGEVPFTDTPDALLYQHIVHSHIRPELPEPVEDTCFSKSGPKLVNLMESCWTPDPLSRPTFAGVSITTKSILGNLESGALRSRSVPVALEVASNSSVKTSQRKELELTQRTAAGRTTLVGSIEPPPPLLPRPTSRPHLPIPSPPITHGAPSGTTSLTLTPASASFWTSTNSAQTKKHRNPIRYASTGQTARKSVPGDFKVLVVNTFGPGKTEIMGLLAGPPGAVTQDAAPLDTVPVLGDAVVEYFKYNDMKETVTVSLEYSGEALNVNVMFPEAGGRSSSVSKDSDKEAKAEKSRSTGFLSSILGVGSGVEPAHVKLRLALPHQVLETLCVNGGAGKTFIEWQDIAPSVETVQIRLRRGNVMGFFNGYTSLAMETESGKLDVRLAPKSGFGGGSSELKVGTGSVNAVVQGFQGKVDGAVGVGRIAFTGCDPDPSKYGDDGSISLTGSGWIDGNVCGYEGRGVFKVSLSVGTSSVAFRK